MAHSMALAARAESSQSTKPAEMRQGRGEVLQLRRAGGSHGSSHPTPGFQLCPRSPWLTILHLQSLLFYEVVKKHVDPCPLTKSRRVGRGSERRWVVPLSGDTGERAGGWEQRRVQREPSEGDLRNKWLCVTVTRAPRGLLPSPPEAALCWVLAEEEAGKGRVAGFPHKRNTGWEGGKFCFGVSRAEAHLCMPLRTQAPALCTSERGPHTATWKSLPNPPFKGKYRKLISPYDLYVST